MAAQSFSIDLFSLFFGLGLGLVLALLAAIMPFLSLSRERSALQARLEAEERSEAKTRDAFTLLAQDALQGAQENFLVLAAEKLQSAQKDGSHDLEKRQLAIAEMVKPLQKHLETLGSTVEQIKGTDLALHNELKSLTRETAKLAGAMRDTAAQGRWGEYILEGVMEHSGLIKGIHYVTQETMSATGHRPDMIINLNDGLKIVVDSKTPLNEFAIALDQTRSEEESLILMQKLSGAVRTHIGALSKKGYWENVDAESVDFTVLFLPSEPLFSMAMRGDPGLADLAANKNIIIASPTLMMALTRVVKMGWRQVDLANNARAISEQGSELYQRLSKFFEHMEKMGKNLTSALDGYNNAVGSLNTRVLPATRKLQELGVQDGGKNVTELNLIEETPRRLTGTENS